MNSKINHTKSLDELLFNVKKSKSFNDELFHKETRTSDEPLTMQHIMINKPNIIIDKDGKVKEINSNGNIKNI